MGQLVQTELVPKTSGADVWFTEPHLHTINAIMNSPIKKTQGKRQRKAQKSAHAKRVVVLHVE
jgi:hypothetical protein